MDNLFKNISKKKKLTASAIKYVWKKWNIALQYLMLPVPGFTHMLLFLFLKGILVQNTFGKQNFPAKFSDFSKLNFISSQSIPSPKWYLTS